MICRTLTILVLLAASLAAQQETAATSPPDELPFVVARPPYGLPETIPDPEANPVTPARLRLGRRLFFEPRLSADGRISCASCHQPEHGWASPDGRSPGVHGKTTTRHAPTLINRAFGKRFMWDGRAETLEEQVLLPIENENEMGLPVTKALERLAEDGAYARAFAEAYPEGLARTSLARALAGFVRRIMLGGSPVDRFRAGEPSKLTTAERTGLWVYESKGGCWKCHIGPNYSDEKLHNTGVGARDGSPRPGRYAITKKDEDRGRFKTPTLRGLAFTAPYMHDGSLKTLEDVVEFYRRGGGTNSHLDHVIKPLDLSDREAEGLVAFLKALSRS